MRLHELKGKLETQQNFLLMQCPQLSIVDILANHKALDNNVLLFRSTLAGFFEAAVDAITFEIIDNKWTVKYWNLNSFTNLLISEGSDDYEIAQRFSALLKLSGFLLTIN